MMVRGVVPLHDQGLEARFPVVADEPGGVCLLVDQHDAGAQSQQSFVSLVAEAQVLPVDLCRNERADQLSVAAPHQFALF